MGRRILAAGTSLLGFSVISTQSLEFCPCDGAQVEYF